MSERDEVLDVLDEFGVMFVSTNSKRMAQALIDTRTQLAAAERKRDALQKVAVLQDAWEGEAMADITALMKERNDLRTRAERMGAVVESADAYERLHVKLIAEGASERYPSRVFDDLCVELDAAANTLCTAVRAVRALDGGPV